MDLLARNIKSCSEEKENYIDQKLWSIQKKERAQKKGTNDKNKKRYFFLLLTDQTKSLSKG